MIDLIENKLFFNSVYSVDIDMDICQVVNYVDKLQNQGQFYQRNQSQGKQTKNFDKLEQPELLPIFEITSKIVDTIAIKWGIQRQLRLINFWFNLDRKHDYSLSHYHVEGILSGILYIKVPNNTSRIIFERPDLQEHYFEGDLINEYNFKNYSYDAVERQLLLFPSYLKHRVEQNLTEDSDDRRISMSFNYGI
jgi:uncharacterized protein (TIGR02466 family)